MSWNILYRRICTMVLGQNTSSHAEPKKEPDTHFYFVRWFIHTSRIALGQYTSSHAERTRKRTRYIFIVCMMVCQHRPQSYWVNTPVLTRNQKKNRLHIFILYYGSYKYYMFKDNIVCAVLPTNNPAIILLRSIRIELDSTKGLLRSITY